MSETKWLEFRNGSRIALPPHPLPVDRRIKGVLPAHPTTEWLRTRMGECSRHPLADQEFLREMQGEWVLSDED